MALRATCPRVPGPNNEGLATKCHGPSHSCRVLNVTRAPLYQPTDGQLNHQRSSEVEAEHNDTDVFYFLHHLSFFCLSGYNEGSPGNLTGHGHHCRGNSVHMKQKSYRELIKLQCNRDLNY